MTHCDGVKKQISMNAKELIETIKQQEKQLRADVDRIMTEQIA